LLELQRGWLNHCDFKFIRANDNIFKSVIDTIQSEFVHMSVKELETFLLNQKLENLGKRRAKMFRIRMLQSKFGLHLESRAFKLTLGH
jgi:hypothetical protein